MTSSDIPTQRLQVACFNVIEASGSLEMSQTMQSVKAVMVRNCSLQLAASHRARKRERFDQETINQNGT